MAEHTQKEIDSAILGFSSGNYTPASTSSTPDNATAQAAAKKVQAQATNTGRGNTSYARNEALATHQKLAAQNTLSYTDIANAAYWNSTKGRGHASTARNTYMTSTPAARALEAGLGKYGSTMEWYNNIKSERDKAKTALSFLNDEKKNRDTLNRAKATWAAENWSRDEVEEDDLDERISAAERALQMAEEEYGYAKDYNDYELDSAWEQNLLDNGISWGNAYGSTHQAQVGLQQQINNVYAELQRVQRENKNAGIFGAGMREEASAAKVAELEAEYDRLLEQQEMVDRRQKYALSKMSEDSQAVARGQLRADFLLEQDERTQQQGKAEFIENYTKGNTMGGVWDALRSDRSDFMPTNAWSQEQLLKYQTLLGYGYEDRAREYAAQTNKSINDTKMEEATQSKYEWGYGADATGVGRALRTVAGTAATVATAPERLASYLNKVQDVYTTGVYTGEDRAQLHDYAEAIASGRAQAMNDRHGTIDGKGWGDLYQAINSVAQSMVYGNALGKAGTLAIFFGQAADSGFDEAIARGATGEQAALSGLLSGAAEVIAEKIPLDNLLATDKAAARGLAKSILKQSGLEGAEEGITSLMNTFADKLVMGDKSALDQQIKELMAEGMSYEDARAKTMRDYANSVAWDVVIGAVSGGISSGVQYGVDAISPYTDRYGADAQTLIEEAKQIKDKSGTLRKAEAKVSKGKAISNATAKKLVTTVNRSRVVDAVEKQINARSPEIEQKTARSLANAVVAKSRSERLTDNQRKLIEKNTELVTEIEKDMSDSNPADWVKAIGVRGAEAAVYGDRNVINAQQQRDETMLNSGEYAEAKAANIEDGQDVQEYSEDFDVVAEVFGNSNNYQSFDEVWDSIKADTILTEAQARNAWETGKARLAKTDMSPRLTRKGTGNLSFEAVSDGGVQYEAPSAEETETFKRSARYQYLEALAKKIGVDIVFFKGGAEGINGKYQNGTVYLAIDASPTKYDTVDGYVMLTAAHELIHYIRETSPARYAELKDFVTKHLIEQGKLENGKTLTALIAAKRRAYANAGVELSVDAAVEEVIADACEMMLKDNMLVAELRGENPGLHGMMSKWLKKFIAKVKAAFTGLDAHHAEAKGMMDSFDELQRIWNLGLTEAAQAEVMEQEGDFSPDHDGVVVDEAGEPVAMSTREGSVQLSIKTYEDSGRDAFRSYLEKCVASNRLTEAEMQEMLDGIEDIYQVCKEFKDEYAPFSKWSDAEVIRDTYGKPVFSVVTPNGDYKMNLDFSLVCRKRRTLDAVFNEMSKRGIIDDFELGQKSVVRINEIIRKHGFETACALCFVDAKRFRQAAMADSFVSLYNELVKSLVPEGRQGDITHFNFGGSALYDREAGKQGIDTWNNSELDFSHLRDVMKNYGKGTVEHKAAKYIMEHAEGRKLLFRGDFMSSAGFDEVKIKNKDILKLYNSKKGTGGPKAAFGDVQYMNEILSKSRSWTPGKAYDVGGVRVQSFSDYVPRMVFDYVQMIYDLAAVQLPAHAYTKEALFVKQFGLAGIKINMSLIPAIADNGIAPGLDARGNYVWAGESFDYATAVEVQNAEGYTENCGTICVGVSDEHIRKLIDDPNIRMVIPYHKSGLNPIVAHMNRVAAFTDYTDKQRTKGSDGVAVKKDFDFNKQLHRMGADGDPKMVAQMYLDWCADNGYTPKFADFADSENYYKLLIDFTVYDKSGMYVPQRAVKGVFPKKGDAFGTMSQLIRSGLEEDAVIEGRRDESIGSIVDEIARSIPKAEADIAEVQVAQAEGDVEAAYVRDISGGKYAIKYPQFSEADIKKNSETLRSMDVVKTLSGDEFKDDGNRLFDKVTAFFNSLGNNVYSDVFGDVALTRSSARSDIRHGLTKNKITSFAAIPEVIKNGTVIDYFKKDSNLERIVVAAPISISDEKYYMGVMLQRDKSSQRLYLHDVVIEKEPTSQTAEHLSTTGPLASEGKLYITNILHKALGVNENTDAPRTLSIKDEAQSDRMLLANTLYSAAQNDGERRRLNNYKAQIDVFEDIQQQLADAEDELSRAYRTGDKQAIAKAQRERNALTEKLIRADKKLLELQATKPLKELMARVKQDTRRHTQRLSYERRNKKELRDKIKKLHKDMTAQLLKPKENKYVPTPLLKTVAELLDEINLDSGRSEKIKAKMTELSGQYQAIAKSNEYGYAFDNEVAGMIAQLQTVIAEKDDTSIYHMSKAELEMVYNTMKAINHTVRESVKLIGVEENRNIFELAKAMMKETGKANPVASKLANKYINATLRPDVFFKRMGGYVKNSVWQFMGDMLNEAQRKQTQLQMEGAAIFEELMRDTDAFDKMTDPKNLIDIGLEDESGKPVLVTMDIALKIYMDTMAEDNARHFMSGGYTIPNMREYYKGKVSDAFSRGSVTIHGFGPLLADLEHQLRSAETEEEQAEIKQKIEQAEADAATWVETLRQNIFEQMGEYEMQWVSAAEKFFNQFSQRVLNETTMAVYGFEKATVPYYVPIHTDAAYRQANFESISRDMSLENSGFMKQRVKASNPVLAEGIVDVINGQIDKVAKYAAMMPAIRNFQKVYGKSTSGFENSVQAAVRSKYGNEALKYIENIITDLTSPRRTEGGLLGEFADRLRGNLAQAALTVNPRVALEQATSYPKAAVIVGYGPLLKAMRDIRSNPIKDAEVRAEIAQWTPLMWYRMKGYFDRDIGDLRNDKQMLDKVNNKLKFITGWIEAVEGSTVGQMWYAAQYYVEDTTDLERGTDEFMQETAKIFNRIVEQTQANYTMFQRPDILRNPNAIVKQLTMFMTERLQNANMVFDAVGTYNAYVKDYRNGENDVTEEDVRRAKQTVVRTTSSLMAATAASVAFKLATDALMYSMKGYRDDDEELTAESIIGQAIENFFESIAGNFLWGSELFSIMRSVITGETYYGISLGGVETFTDALNALVKTIQEPTWENWKKSIKTGMQMLGIPLNNGIKIYNAIAYRIKDAQEDNYWGDFASEVKLTEEQRNKQLYKAVVNGDDKKVNRLFEYYGTEAEADAALAKHIKTMYQNDELSAEEAQAQLEDYASMSEYDAKLDISKLTCKKETGIAYEDLRQAFIDKQITEEQAVEYRAKYGLYDKSDAEKEVRQWACERETGYAYDDLPKYLASEDITKQQAIEYRMEYGGQDLEDASVQVTKWMGEIETGIPYNKVEDYYRDGLVTYDELVDYYMKYWSYDELKAIQVADKRAFIGTDERLEDASLAAVSGYYGYCEEANVDKYMYLTAYQFCYAVRADKDANGKSISGTALKKKLVYIDGLNLQSFQKTAIAKAIGITDKQLKKYKAAWL